MASMLTKIFLATSLLISFNVNAEEQFCYSEDKIFKSCADQNEIFKEATAKAISEGKRVLLVYGFETCAWTNSIVKSLTLSSFADEIRNTFVLVPISSRYTTTGKELATRLQEKFKQPEAAGWGVPQLYLIDPVSENGVILNMADYERNTDATEVLPAYRGYHVDQVMKAIRDVNSKVK